MKHAEELQTYLDALGLAKKLKDEYLYNLIKKMIATYCRQLNRAYKRNDTDVQ